MPALTTPESVSSAPTEASEGASERTTPLLSQPSSTSSSRPDLTVEAPLPAAEATPTGAPPSKSPPQEEEGAWHTVATKPAPRSRDRSRDYGDKQGKGDKGDWHRRDASNPRTAKGGNPSDRPPQHRRTRSSGAATTFSQPDKARSRAPDVAWGKASSSTAVAAPQEAQETQQTQPATAGAWGKASSKPTFAQLLRPEETKANGNA